jgi:dephospho-CoA kinase
MTEEKFDSILARQMPDADKRALADHVIDTGTTLERTRDQTRALVDQLTGRHE